MLSITEHLFSEPIWKIYVDSFNPQLWVIETRSEVMTEAYFSALLLQDKPPTFLLHEHSLAEAWWLGISLVAHGKIYFYHYPQQERPEASGIIAFDIAQKKVIWEKYHLKYTTYTQDFLVGSELIDGQLIYYALDFATGEILQKHSKLNIFSPFYVPTFIANPNHYRKDTNFFHYFVDFCKKTLNLHKISAVDYMEYDNIVVLSYFAEENSIWQNAILFINKEGRVLHHAAMCNNLQAISENTFVRIGNKIAYIQHKHKLFIVETSFF